MKNITAKNEKQFIIDILIKENIIMEDAEKVGDVLVAADIRGISSHGLSRLKKYLDRIKLGLIAKESNLITESQKAGNVLLNSNNSLGQVVAVDAMEMAIELAKEHGNSVIAAGHSNHFGIAAYYTMMAAKEDLIGIVTTNTSPLMAPFGGKSPMLGTNPISVAVPADQYEDIVIDMATSEVAIGKIEVAQREGLEIPLGWALDKNGKPTTDPDTAMDGTVTSMSGPKGSALAMLVDILSGFLTHSAFLDDVGSLSKIDAEQDLGFFMMVINPDIFIPRDTFKTQIDAYIGRVKNSPKAEGVEEIFMPGEIEARKTQEHLNNGIDIPDGLVYELTEIGKKME